MDLHARGAPAAGVTGAHKSASGGLSGGFAGAVWNFRRLVLFPERGRRAGDNRLGLARQFAFCDRLCREQHSGHGAGLRCRSFFARNHIDFCADHVRGLTPGRRRPQPRYCCADHRAGGQLFSFSCAAHWVHVGLSASDRSGTYRCPAYIAQFSPHFFVQLVLGQGMLVLLLVCIAIKQPRYAAYILTSAVVVAVVALATDVTDVGLLLGEMLPFYATIFILAWNGAFAVHAKDASSAAGRNDCLEP